MRKRRTDALCFPSVRRYIYWAIYPICRNSERLKIHRFLCLPINLRSMRSYKRRSATLYLHDVALEMYLKTQKNFWDFYFNRPE